MRLVLICAMALALLLSGPVLAQERQAPAEIKRISSEIMRSPRYDVSRSSLGRSQERDWLMVSVEYDTRPEWIDELVVTVYLLVTGETMGEGGRGGPPDAVLRGQATYVDIKEGSHRAVMFLQPSALERFGEVRAVGVEILVGGRVSDSGSEPSSRSAWWTRAPNIEGRVVDRLASPWAMLYFDELESIKAPGTSR